MCSLQGLEALRHVHQLSNSFAGRIVLLRNFACFEQEKHIGCALLLRSFRVEFKPIPGCYNDPV